MVTVTSASAVERGTVLAEAREPARFDPKMEAIEPGATGPVAKVAPFTTPFGAITGA
jgi:hypothetical protein